MIKLFNTLARQKQDFIPQAPERVTLYVCGPTVYNHCHIGNFRPVVVFDTLFRLLRHRYGEDHVVYARNITDINDTIIETSLDVGLTIEQLTHKYADIYNAESRALNALRPTIEPWATVHVPQMIDMIKTLVDEGHAYVEASGVWFHVPSMADYGQLSGRKPEDNEAGARVAVADEKRDPADFALWKFAKPGEPEDAIWDSPWGRGRPGWHIECSAMAAAQLGTTIDIHGGGIDLQFPHHENEIAQSQCAHGAPMARYWMHNGFLDLSGEKMSKSIGNVVLIKDLLKDWPGEVIRFALLSGHYRSQLDWNPDLLAQAKATLDRIYGALGRVWKAEDIAPDDESISSALADDLNTPIALSALSTLATHANTAAESGNPPDMAIARANLLAAGNLLGLLQSHPDEWAKGTDADDNARIDALVAARNTARAEKNWAEADRIRDQLAEEGIEIMDGSQDASWRRI